MVHSRNHVHFEVLCQLTWSIFLIKQWDNYEQANGRIWNKAEMDILPFTYAEGGEGQLG
jgi:hypothetical protein